MTQQSLCHPEPTPPADDHRASVDGGFTLLEVVIAVVLVGLVVVPMMEATLTSVRASSRAREAAEVDTVLHNAANRVARAPLGCDYAMYAEAAAIAHGWQGSQVRVTAAHYRAGASARAADQGEWLEDACPDGARTPNLVQLITIAVTAGSGTVQRTLMMVKSNV